MASKRIFLFSAVILAAVLFLLIPHHAVKASGNPVCIGACGSTNSPPPTCINGGTPPFFFPQNLTATTGGSIAYVDVPQVSNCYIVVTSAVATYYASTSAIESQNFTYWIKSGASSCANAMPGSVTSAMWVDPLVIGPYNPKDSFVYNGDQPFVSASGTDLCVGFMGNVSGQYETVTVEYVYR